MVFRLKTSILILRSPQLVCTISTEKHILYLKENTNNKAAMQKSNSEILTSRDNFALETKNGITVSPLIFFYLNPKNLNHRTTFTLRNKHKKSPNTLN